MLNLDTHILLFALSGDLTAGERQLLSGDEWCICGIVLWEITKLSQLGRIQINLENREFVRLLSQIHVWPISLDICRGISRLDFKSDPVDELIAATSVVQQVPLLTRDHRILKSKIVPLA